MLDQPGFLRANDLEDMEGRIREFPEQCLVAWDAAGQCELPALGDVRAVAIFGMGGSAIGADLVRCLADTDTLAPIVVIRDYQLPGWVGPGTLAIGASHSGSTEETLTSMRAAIAAGATPIALTGGGPLGDLVLDADGTIVPVRYRARPRAALAHLFLPLLRVLARLGLIADRSAELAATVPALQAMRDAWAPEAAEAGNEAKQVARALDGRLPVVVGAGHLAPVAVRWKGQINENAEGWAVSETLPEMNHNVVVGFGLPAEVAKLVSVVFLASPLLPDRLRLRIEVTGDLLDRAGIPHRTILATGLSPLADQLELVHLGDWTSFYLAALRGVDPSRMEPIDQLKAALASRA
ncbi:MAG: bifunctional phosphoglucose/phosphomannose isomerase [Dehalococcoidia bacterium]